MQKPRLAIVTLGCDKNRVDTEQLLSQLSDLCEFASVEEAEYILINTCGFLEEARQELYAVLESFSKEQKLILAGCFWKFADKKFFAKFPNVVRFVKADEYGDFRKRFEELSQLKPVRSVKVSQEVFLTPPSYAYLKVAEGCDNHCTFCIIPQLKGSYQSRKVNEILKSAKKHLKRGISELILVAQDVGNYGVDLELNLLDLLKELEKLEKLKFIRLLYIYPERINQELLTYIRTSKKVLPYFDIPLQHASDKVLKLMGRPYTQKAAKKLLADIRKTLPEAVIRSTFIVGFPGETEKDFAELKNFLNKEKLNHVGIFTYSDEELCSAHKLSGKISDKIKEQRKAEIMQLQQKISAEHLSKFVGKKINVLVDENPEENVYCGRNYYFAPEVDGVICFHAEKSLRIGASAQVRITEAEEYDLFGE